MRECRLSSSLHPFVNSLCMYVFLFRENCDNLGRGEFIYILSWNDNDDMARNSICIQYRAIEIFRIPVSAVVSVLVLSI